MIKKERDNIYEEDANTLDVSINHVYKVGEPIKEMPVMSKEKIEACKAAVEKYLPKK